MAMSILYLHRNFSKDAHHGKVFQISNLGSTFIRWKPRGSLRNPRNRKRGGQGLPIGPAASFVIPGDSKAAPGSPAYEYGSQLMI